MQILLVLAFVLLPTVSWAVSLSPNFGFGFLHGTSLAQQPDLAGTIIADTSRQLDVLLATQPGGSTSTRLEVRDWVVQTGRGTLDFYRQVICCGASSTVRIETLRSSGFDGFTTDAEFRTNLGGKEFEGSREVPGSQTATRPISDHVTFRYGTAGFHLTSEQLPLEPIFVRTDATSFNEGGILRLVGLPDCCISPKSLFPGFYAPAQGTIPEPSLSSRRCTIIMAFIAAMRKSRGT